MHDWQIKEAVRENGTYSFYAHHQWNQTYHLRM